jgi:tetratricopeptide (TPR) repeat protein
LTPPAASERADAVVTGTVRIERGLLVIAPELFIVQTRSRIPILPLSDKVSEYPALRAQLSRRVGEYLSGGLSTDGKWVLTDLASSTLDATTALARGKAVSQENPGLARLFFYRVLTLQPDSAEAMYFIGSGQLGQRRFSDAVLYFQKTLMPGARLPEELRVAAYLGLGQALSGIGNYPDAIKAYESAVQAKPDDPSLYRELARVYIFENHFSDADEYFRRAIDKEPRDIESYYGRGLMALRRNGEDDAVGFFRQALAIDSTHESARGALADVFARQAAKNAIAKQWDAAIAEVNEELLYRESARAYFLRGYYNVEAAKGDQDRYRAAIKDNQRALDLMGKNPVLGLRTPIMLNTTELHLLTKQYDEAKVWATRSLREVTEPSGRTIARFLLVVAKILSQEEYAEDQKRLRNDLKETGARSSWNFGTLEALLRADKTIGDAERQAALALSAEAKGTPPRP